MSSKTKAKKFVNQSYSKLQEQTGIDRAVWSRYFNGKVSPRMKLFEDLAQIADVPLWDLIDAFSDRRRKNCEGKTPKKNKE